MEFILLPILAALIVFMFINGRRRQKQMKADQEEKATKTVPGAKVLLQGGIYGTVVAYDHEDLDTPALIEISPGTVIEVHSQAILRVVEPKDVIVEEAVIDVPDALGDTTNSTPVTETAEETRARLERDADDK